LFAWDSQEEYVAAAAAVLEGAQNIDPDATIVTASLQSGEPGSER